MTCPVAPSVGAYALGTLDPAEHAEVARHLPSCPQCREALAEVAPLPALLARVSPADAAGPGQVVPDDALLQRVLAGAAAHRRTQRTRRRWLAAVAAAVLLVGGGLGAGLALRSPGGPTPVTVSAAQGAVHGQARLTSAPSGTRVALQLSGVPADEHCRLVAVGRDGTREVAASWEATYTGTASVTGTTSLGRGQLASLTVETFQGRTLLSLPVTG